jgi:hypothetical protein
MDNLTYTFQTKTGRVVMAADCLERGKRLALRSALSNGLETLVAITGHGSVFDLTPILDRERVKRIGPPARTKNKALLALEWEREFYSRPVEEIPGYPFK